LDCEKTCNEFCCSCARRPPGQLRSIFIQWLGKTKSFMVSLNNFRPCFSRL
jgi:hypothetical protein